MTDRPALTEPATAAGKIFLANEMYDRFDSAIDDSFIWLAIEAEAGAAPTERERALEAALREWLAADWESTWETMDLAQRTERLLAQPAPGEAP